MKRSLIVLVLVFTIANLYGQDYFPLVKNNAVWNITNVNFALEPWDHDSYHTWSYRIFGDTLINTTIYKKLWEVNCFDETFNEETSEFYAAIREEDKKVFLYKNGNEYCIYDFSLEVNDTFSYYSFFNHQDITLKVESIETIMINDELRKLFYFIIQSEIGGWVVPWIEGIGSQADLFESVYPTGTFDVYLNCYKENNELIYSQFDNDCCKGLTEIGNIISAPPNLKVYPNPAKTHITIGSETAQTLTIEIFELTGKLVSSEKVQTNEGFNISSLSKGVYLYKITDEEGNLFINKFIKQ